MTSLLEPGPAGGDTPNHVLTRVTASQSRGNSYMPQSSTWGAGLSPERLCGSHSCPHVSCLSVTRCAFTAPEPVCDGHRSKGRWLSEGIEHVIVAVNMGVSNIIVCTKDCDVWVMLKSVECCSHEPTVSGWRECLAKPLVRGPYLLLIFPLPASLPWYSHSPGYTSHR